MSGNTQHIPNLPEEKVVRSRHKSPPLRLIGFVFILLLAFLTYMAFRRRAFLLASEPQIRDIEPEYQGLAIQSAVTLLSLGFFIGYLLLRSLEGIVLRSLRHHMPALPRLRITDLTVLTLLSFAVSLPATSYSVVDAAPWPALLPVPVIAVLTAHPQVKAVKPALLLLIYSVCFMLMGLAALGRWRFGS